jgi:hypothetical protein
VSDGFLRFLNEIVIKQAVFELIDGTAGLARQVVEPNRDQVGTAHMNALDARAATLDASQSGPLFACALQLLDLSAEDTPFLCRLGGILSGVIDYAPIHTWVESSTRNRPSCGLRETPRT